MHHQKRVQMIEYMSLGNSTRKDKDTRARLSRHQLIWDHERMLSNSSEPRNVFFFSQKKKHRMIQRVKLFAYPSEVCHLLLLLYFVAGPAPYRASAAVLQVRKRVQANAEA